MILKPSKNKMSIRRRIRGLFGLVLACVLLGTVSYRFLLDITWLDSFYMTIITVSTVGYSEVVPLTAAAKLFTSFLILSSVSTFAFALSQIMSAFLQGDLRKEWRKELMDKRIAKLQGHYIICGFNRTGQYVVKDFQREAVDFVIVDKDEHVVDELEAAGFNVILGDATEEDVLARTGIMAAKGLVSTLSRDSDNVYVVLTARRMNPSLQIVSRAIEPGSREKLLLAGADNTVSSNEIGGHRLVSTVLHPTVVDFLDTITRAGEVEYDLETAFIDAGAILDGLTLAQARIPDKTGLIVIAIRHASDKSLNFSPNSQVKLNAGDMLVVLGKREQINALQKLVKL